MGTCQQVYGFPYGQMDPEYAARSDLKAYYLGALEARNLAPRAAGGLDRRPGLAFVAELPQMANGVRLARFEREADAFYLVAITPERADIYRDNAHKANVTLPYLQAELPDLDWTQSWDTMLLFHAGHAIGKLMWNGDDATWVVSTQDITNPPTRQYGADTTGSVTFSAKSGTGVAVSSTAADFATAQVGWVVHMPSGHGIITAVTDSQHVTVTMADELKAATNPTTADAGDWSVEEPVFSATRGWPETGCFDGNGRLVLGASNGVYGSQTGRYFNFLTTSDGNDDEAVAVALDDDQANRVRSVFNADHLIAITSGGPFAVPDAPITPKGFYLKRINRTRAAKVKPAEVDGVVAMVSDGSDGAYQSVFELSPEPAADSRYSCRDLALMASAVVKRPVDMAARRGSGSNSANFLYVVNSDGTLGVLHSRREQQVTAWTPWDTTGQILATAVTGNTAYFAVKRTIAGVDRYFLERLDPDHLGDCSVRQTSDTPQTVWTGFDHLDGQVVRVVADGAEMGDVTVTGGTITLDFPASVVEAGLPFSWSLKPMPIERQLADGTSVAHRARIWKVAATVQDTQELWIDGKRQELRRFDRDRFDTAPPSYSGDIAVRRLGRDTVRTVPFAGYGMAKATILSVTLFVTA